MSPLAPHANNSQTFNQPANEQLVDPARILTPPPPPPSTDNGRPKYVYSMGDLFGLRHNQSRLPNLSNRQVLASVSRTNVTQTSDFANMLNLGLMASAMNPVRTDRRQYNNYRTGQRNQNGGYTSNGFNDRDRPYQPNRDRGNTNGIQVRLSIKTDVKLNEAENAWKPTFMQKNTKNDNAEELYKQVRSILNKLTAQNFPVLSEQFQKLPIDSKEKLVEVINLVFNKAVNEPNFSEGYGKLCQYLSHCSQQIDSSSAERAYFKRTLINKCQIEFEQHVANKNTTDAALAPLMEKLSVCEKQSDTTGANEIKAQIAEEESTLRRRLVSTVRFIGELYKLDMLTTNIMNVCVSTLIREAAPNQSNPTQANEKLECLCKLLTTVGAKLERKPIDKTDTAKTQQLDLTCYINQLKRIADNKIRNFKASTRIRFMIMDVLELRNNKWTPKITNAALQTQRSL